MGLIPLLGGLAGTRLVALPLLTWEGSARLGSPRPVNRAIWSSLGRSLGELSSILTNGVDHKLNMALSHTLVRPRHEVSTNVSRPMGEREASECTILVQKKYSTIP